MSKIRIYELAKELGVDNKTLEQIVRDLGIQIKNYMSTLSPEEATRVRAQVPAGHAAKSAVKKADGTKKPARTSKPAKPIRRKAAGPRPSEKAEAEAAESEAPTRHTPVRRRAAQQVPPSRRGSADSAASHSPSRPIVRSGATSGQRSPGSQTSGPVVRSGTRATSARPSHTAPAAHAASVESGSRTVPSAQTHAAPGGQPAQAGHGSAGSANSGGAGNFPAAHGSSAAPSVSARSSEEPKWESDPAASQNRAPEPGDVAAESSGPSVPAKPTPSRSAPANAGAAVAVDTTTPVRQRSGSAGRSGAQTGKVIDPALVGAQPPAAANPASASTASTAPAGPSTSAPKAPAAAPQVGDRIALPKNTRRFRGGMAERLDAASQQQVQPRNGRSAASPAGTLRREQSQSPANVHSDAASSASRAAQANQATQATQAAQASAGSSNESVPSEADVVAAAMQAQGIEARPEAAAERAELAAARARAAAQSDADDTALAESRAGVIPATQSDNTLAAIEQDRERDRAPEARRKLATPVADITEPDAGEPELDENGRQVVRDESGVIVGARSKRSEPKILGFINIEPRKRPQQVIITEANQQSKTGRASARKRREEKIQQQGRRAKIAVRQKQRRDPRRAGGRGVSTVEMSEAKKRLRVDEVIQVSDLAHQMGVKSSRVIRSLWQMGMRGVTINNSIDVETAELVAAEFGYTVENVSFDEDDWVGVEDVEGTELRAPVVAVMGHVDHGKTTLLDYVRDASVVDGEAGGITQHIGAYRVETENGPIVFLDTPGHEAFTAMRSRGASLTDILVLVVAADDGVMPTTLEAIKHANDAEVPVVVVVNKIDKPEANPGRVKQMLMNEGIVGEEFGGDVPIIEASAKTGEGIPRLLELLALQAEVLDLRATAEGRAYGTVIEARIERGRGTVATVLVEWGTLSKGDILVAAEYSGKVRQVLSVRGKQMKEAGPSTPVEVLGLDGIPSAGSKFHVVENEKAVKQLIGHRRDSRRRKETVVGGPSALERLQARKVPCLKIVLRADVSGSAEALADMLVEQSTDRVRVEVINSGVGGISENDVSLASASDAVIIGFNTKTVGKAGPAADSAKVRVFTFDVIYEAADQVRELMIDLLPPEYREREQGKAEVRQIFSIPRLGTVCGCRVIDGFVTRNSHVRVRRGSKIIHTGKVGSLRVFKDDVREVKEGFECGIVVENFTGAEPDDVLESFELETIRPTL